MADRKQRSWLKSIGSLRKIFLKGVALTLVIFPVRCDQMPKNETFSIPVKPMQFIFVQ